MTAIPLVCHSARMRYTVRRSFAAIPEVFDGSWGELVSLFDACRGLVLKSPTKPTEKPSDLPLWFPWAATEIDHQGPGCRTGNMHPEGLWALSYDFDDVTPEQAKIALEKARAFSPDGYAHTTWKHGFTSGVRMRIIMPLPRPVPVSRWQEIWSYGFDAIGGAADPTCNNPGRGYFVPAVNADAPEWARTVWVDHWGSP